MRTQSVVSIDGTYYNVIIPQNGIKRSFSIADTDNAGRLQSGEMKRDIIGTYYNYTIQFDTHLLSYEEYDRLYAALSAPRESHSITVPFGQRTLSFEAYITAGNDTLNIIRNGNNKWQGLSVNFIAMSPEVRP